MRMTYIAGYNEVTIFMLKSYTRRKLHRDVGRVLRLLFAARRSAKSGFERPSLLPALSPTRCERSTGGLKSSIINPNRTISDELGANH